MGRRSIAPRSARRLGCAEFFPYRHTLLYSDHLLGIAIFTAPIQWLTGNAVLAYNAAYLGSIVVAGCGQYLLARELTGRRDAALIAGVIYASSHSAYRIWRICSG
jgi:hypothetical protein